jgi:YkoY family integral membrane protein
MLDQLTDISAQFDWHDLLLLPVLVALEAVLSADNAIALAAITQGLQDPKLEGRALNIGLVFAYVLRMSLILAASWVVDIWQFELAGALYLLWLVFQYFTSSSDGEAENHGPRFKSLWQAIPVIALTDLAFSLDSVTTAIAVSKQTWLVLLGGTLGIVALRFMAQLFIGWLEEFKYLETAGYLTVALVGIRLLVRVFNDSLVPPEWAMVLAVGIIFAWGFSKRKLDENGLPIVHSKTSAIEAPTESPAETVVPSLGLPQSPVVSETIPPLETVLEESQQEA